MNKDFKKGFSISLGILSALIIPTGIYFVSSNLLMRNEAKEEYAEYVEDCQVALIRDWSGGDGILRMMNVEEADINSFSEMVQKI
tara:strand:- start:97 stop:351 length:255 start_codon:yes stop_codon:yes gene_type:complete